MYRGFLQQMLDDLLFGVSAIGKSVLGDNVNWDLKRPFTIESCPM